MLQTFDRALQRFMPLITPSCVILGILFANWLDNYIFLIPWIFAFMTFSGSLGSNFSNLKGVLLNPLPLFACLFVLHVIMPLVALAVGNAALKDEPFLITGLILAFLIPTGITSLIWVSVYKGNVVLTLSIILIDTLLSPIIVPTVLQLFVGTEVTINSFEIMYGLIWMIVIPSIIGMSLNQVTKGRVKARLGTKLSPFSKLGLGAVVAINSSAVAPYFKEVNLKLVLIGFLVFLTASLGYVLGWAIAKLLKSDQKTIISLTYNSGMRNISAGAVIAITYFPAQVALPVIVGMLFQQVIAAFTGGILERFYLKKGRVENLA